MAGAAGRQEAAETTCNVNRSDSEGAGGSFRWERLLGFQQLPMPGAPSAACAAGSRQHVPLPLILCRKCHLSFLRRGLCSRTPGSQ
jgi:hypothetical protein